MSHPSPRPDAPSFDLADNYSPFPPATWDCKPFHVEADDEEPHEGDEDFRIIVDHGGWLVAFDGHTYNGAVSMDRATPEASTEACLALRREGLRITEVTASHAYAHLYILKLRELSDTEKDFLNDISQP